MPRTCAFSILGLLAAAALLPAQDEAREPDSRPGGRLRYRIARGPAEEVEAPDVLTLKNGRKLEAYFLNVYGDRLVFYRREGERSWLREELHRSEIAAVEFDQYMPDLAPRPIEPAAKQPAPKDDFITGVFGAAKGNARFKLTFTSEIDKLFNSTEDATDYGTVEVESKSESGSGKDARSHEASGWGRYYLYAPGTVNNREWVLYLSEVVVREIDRGFDTVLFTNVVPDEAFICRLSPEKDSFQLEWSNLGSWTWSSLTGMTFRRPEKHRGRDREEPVRSPAPGRRSVSDLQPTLVLASRGAAPPQGGAAAGMSAAEPGVRRWRTDGWKAPARRWR